jgi:hypothetical protein
VLIGKDEDTVFESVIDRLSPTARECFPLPPSAQVADNLVSMANFLPLVGELVRALKPQVVAEIGAYRGITTQALLKMAEELDYQLHVVDPALPRESDDPRLTRFKMLSSEYLAESRGATVLFLDGDHNYFTVKTELDLIHASSEDQPLLVLLHDVSWPWGRRDMYYLPETIPQDSKKESVQYSHLSVTSASLTGKGIPMNFHVATDEGGEENGVLGGIEAFIAEHDGYEYVQLPSLFGLGVLWTPGRMSEAQRSVFSATRDRLNWLAPYAATLELNRLMLLARIDDAGTEWHACQRAIAELRSQVAELEKENANLQQNSG